MNKRAAAFICCAAMMLSGCVLGNSVDSLLSPPEISQEQRMVYEALTEAVGKNITLQYPKGGSYRSAFISSDIDSDNEDESIAFYIAADDDKSKGGLRINIIDNIDGRWQSVCDFSGSGAGIDRVIIDKLGNCDRKNLIIGYTSSSGEKNFRSYVYDGKSVVNTFAGGYASIFTADLDNDGVKELSVIQPNNEFAGTKAYYSLIRDDGEVVSESSRVNLSDRTTEYLNIAVGRVASDMPAVFIDGFSGGAASTEIIYCINGILRNPLYLSDSGTITKTIRPRSLLSNDIDLDGIVEIPTQRYFPGYSQESAAPFLITDWNVMDSFEIVKKYSSYYDVEKGYCFILPSRWENIITVKRDSSTGDIVFYKYTSNLISGSDELMRISAVTFAERDERLSNGYTLIKTRDNICYFYKIPSGTNEPLVLTESEIMNNFRVLT